MPNIHPDQPLATKSALVEDKLDRAGFARSVVSALSRVSAQGGFVMSIEGAWGSGKTSTLALVEALLGQVSTKSPIVVRFNPWLVGDRDALLRHFLATVASSIEMGDKSLDAKNAAKELNTYAKVFDFVKLVPGAEPWASLVKSVMEAAGSATQAVAEYKTPDIEERKRRVEVALRSYDRPVVVFVDDIDRLFPQEVFEMVRIIKAVGELPNVGYLLAWDAAYVKASLEKLQIPKPDTYLDKIVQVRLPLPSLSNEAREELMNDAIAKLDPEALKSRFPSDGGRLSLLYHSGLKDLLDQPRDFFRLFNTVGLIEPNLRGEVALADIIGFAALVVKAPEVADLLRSHPRWFVGGFPGDVDSLDGDSKPVQEGSERRSAAFMKSERPSAVRQLIHFLFPAVAVADGVFGVGAVQDSEGHIASPARLLVALQLSVTSSDVSLVKAREFLSNPAAREAIARGLTERNCVGFIESLAELVGKVGKALVPDLPALCVAIAQLADSRPFAERAKNRRSFFGVAPEAVARVAIGKIVEAVSDAEGSKVAEELIRDRHALSVSAGLVVACSVPQRQTGTTLSAPPALKDELTKVFADNVLQAATDGYLMTCSNPAYVLWILSSVSQSSCPQVFDAIRERDSSLDSFAVEVLKDSFDSFKGQSYALKHDTVSAFVPVGDLQRHAQMRLADKSMGFPTRAAWAAVVSEKRLYALDGSDAD